MRVLRSLMFFVLAGVVAFAGTLAWAAGNPSRADLLYDPATGSVTLDTSEAAGGKVTSFQIENAAGTFVPGNYTAPPGNFGGGLEDVTTSVLSDSDPTGVGFSGVHNFGEVFPAGMDQVELSSYLTNNVYTGETGSGQQNLDVLLDNSRTRQSVPATNTLGLGVMGLALLGLGVVAIKRRQGQVG